MAFFEPQKQDLFAFRPTRPAEVSKHVFTTSLGNFLTLSSFPVKDMAIESILVSVIKNLGKKCWSKNRQFPPKSRNVSNFKGNHISEENGYGDVRGCKMGLLSLKFPKNQFLLPPEISGGNRFFICGFVFQEFSDFCMHNLLPPEISGGNKIHIFGFSWIRGCILHLQPLE